MSRFDVAVGSSHDRGASTCNPCFAVPVMPDELRIGLRNGFITSLRNVDTRLSGAGAKPETTIPSSSDGPLGAEDAFTSNSNLDDPSGIPVKELLFPCVEGDVRKRT